MDDKTLGNSHYGYSAIGLSSLAASEYTLVTIAADRSGSIHAFRHEIEACLSEILRATRGGVMADNVMVRVTSFADTLREDVGFKPVLATDPDSMKGLIRDTGCTALYDASLNAVEATTAWAETLCANGLAINAVIFVVTDGQDNASSATATDVAAAVRTAIATEAVQDITTVLVGVNVADASVGRSLMDFSVKAGFDQYIELAKADRQTLARLARFATRSITASSVALQGGHAVKSLSF